MIDSKRIAKNTVFLYFRMILIMGVTLYSSRVVLDKLGVEDFALYNVVYSLIGIFSFLSGTLSIGTSRFITFELGVNNKDNLKSTFSTALISHVLLALILLIIGQTIGLWYVNNILVIEEAKIYSANVVYQISILSTCVAIIQVPFTSCIIAHEKMNIYAYIGIFEAIGKLLIVYALNFSLDNKLILYALMMLGIYVSVMLIYVVFCYRLFEEARTVTKPKKNIFISILKFSGWNILANISNTLLSEGIILLFNLFFQPVVVVAQGIAKQISSGLMMFVSNIRVAVNPQITKLYANGALEDSKNLTLNSAEFIFYLLLLLGVPCIIVMPTLLDIWLVEVPDYAVPFARLIVIQNILDNFNAAFYTPMTAANKIKKNSIAALSICIIQFIILYLLFKCGLGPLWAWYVGIVTCIIFSYIIKPIILFKDIGYPLKDVYSCIFQCSRVGIVVSALSFVIYKTIPQNSFIDAIYICLLSSLLNCIIIFIFLNKDTKYRLYNLVKNKIIRHE